MKLFDMITKEWEQIFEEVEGDLVADEKYRKESAEFDKLLKTLVHKDMLAISDKSSDISRLSIEAAYSRGYIDAMRLLTSSISN